MEGIIYEHHKISFQELSEHSLDHVIYSSYRDSSMIKLSKDEIKLKVNVVSGTKSIPPPCLVILSHFPNILYLYTLFRHMRILHGTGFSRRDLDQAKSIIYNNLGK